MAYNIEFAKLESILPQDELVDNPRVNIFIDPKISFSHPKYALVDGKTVAGHYYCKEI